jgi:hypothetical protein
VCDAVCRQKTYSEGWDVAFHTMTPLPPAQAKRLPSGLNASPVTLRSINRTPSMMARAMEQNNISQALAVARDTAQLLRLYKNPMQKHRPDLGFIDRRNDLLGNGNSLGLKPLNVVGTQQILLTPATNRTSSNGTVHGDTTADTLLGSLNAPNWFFVDASGTDTDNYSSERGDKKSSVK